MIIISKFKDYYDWAAHVYRDENLVYKREEKKEKVCFRASNEGQLSRFKFFISGGAILKGGDTWAAGGMLYVAGKVYPLFISSYWVKAPKKNVHYNYRTHDRKIKYFIPVDEHQKEILLEHLHSKHPYLFNTLRWQRRSFDKKIDQWLENVLSYDNDVHGLFDPKESPIQQLITHNNSDYKQVDFEYTFRKKIDFNLGDIGFQKIVDPLELMQELSMFVGYHQTNENDLVEIDDKNMITQKGFDPKYGFRKAPTKRKHK